jgi:hypothetical protein
MTRCLKFKLPYDHDHDGPCSNLKIDSCVYLYTNILQVFAENTCSLISAGYSVVVIDNFVNASHGMFFPSFTSFICKRIMCVDYCSTIF